MLQWEVLPQTEYELFLRKWYLLKITYRYPRVCIED